MQPDISLQARHGRLCLPWRTLLLSLITVLIYTIAGSAPDGLVYNRQAIEQGDLWSLISGHWVHSDRQHAIWNIAALLILGSLFEPVLKQRLFSDLLIASLLLSIWIGAFMPELQAYCGLSGILNTLLVSGCMSLWQQHRSPLLLLFLLLAFCKNLFELYHQQAMFTHTAWPSVPEAHLVGMACGFLLFLARSSLRNL